MYNPNTAKNSFIETYIRNQRSDNPIHAHNKRSYVKKSEEEPNIFIRGEIANEDQFLVVTNLLKNKVVANSNDRDEVSKRMFEININRYQWIHTSHPTITDILSQFPRYTDCPELVS